MITVGPMALNQPQVLDPMEPFFTGTQSGGGYWTDISRLSSHDHSGGLMGAAVAVSIPDGSITAADLDPSVLLPYALVDGSKPFTGQVTVEADAVVRDALSFGQQGTALAPDASLARIGARSLATDSSLTVTPAAGQPALTTAGWIDLTITAAYSPLRVFAGATPRLEVASTGTLTLTPSGGAALVATIGDSTLQVLQGGGSDSRLLTAGNLALEPTGGYVLPFADNTKGLGHGSFRWTAVYAVAGAINTSTADRKEGITPLSPAACYQAAKDVRWYEYAYLPPAYTPPEPPPGIAYDASDDNETKAEKKAARDEAEAASKAAYARMLVETAPARNQRGFVFPAGAESKDEAGGTLPPVPDLFGLSDRESTTPQADLATLGCALQHVIARLEALEATEGAAA